MLDLPFFFDRTEVPRRFNTIIISSFFLAAVLLAQAFFNLGGLRIRLTIRLRCPYIVEPSERLQIPPKRGSGRFGDAVLPALVARPRRLLKIDELPIEVFRCGVGIANIRDYRSPQRLPDDTLGQTVHLRVAARPLEPRSYARAQVQNVAEACQ